MENDTPQGTSIEDRIMAAEVATDDQPTPQSMADSSGKPDTPAPMPSAEQTPDAEQSNPETPATPSPEGEEELTAKDLMPDASERTQQQFQKMLDSNAALVAQNKQLQQVLGQRQRPQANQQDTSVFDVTHPQVDPQYQRQWQQLTDAKSYDNLSQKQVDKVVENFVTTDENGERVVDIERLTQALSQADQRAIQAEQRAQRSEDRIEQFEITQQTREAYSTFPQLDPRGEKFDVGFSNAVRNHMVYNHIKQINQPFVDAAREVAQYYRAPQPEVNLDKVKEEAVNEFKRSQQTRQSQGPIEAGKGARRSETSDLKDLRKKSFSKNKKTREKAIEERLSLAGEL